LGAPFEEGGEEPEIEVPARDLSLAVGMNEVRVLDERLKGRPR
jgi:hypothetical protein